ncbi:hypothetical protein JCM10212_002434 [Sporobolomyces blumeae]
MFTSFSQGSDDPSNWNDLPPAYRPGRFHAHPFPSSSSSSSRTPRSTGPIANAVAASSSSSTAALDDHSHRLATSPLGRSSFPHSDRSPLTTTTDRSRNPNSSKSREEGDEHEAALTRANQEGRWTRVVGGRDPRRFFRRDRRLDEERNDGRTTTATTMARTTTTMGDPTTRAHGKGRQAGPGSSPVERDALLPRSQARVRPTSTPQQKGKGKGNPRIVGPLPGPQRRQRLERLESFARRDDGFNDGEGGGGGGGPDDDDDDDDDEEHHGPNRDVAWLLLRPGKKKVRRWMASWSMRWALLVGLPCLIVWVWCSIPFPVSDPYKEEPPWHIPWPPSPDPPGRFETLLRRLPWIPDPPSPVSMVAAEPPRSVYFERGAELRPSDMDGFEHGEAAASEPVAAETVAAGPGDASQTPRRETDDDDDLPVDANFYFFLVVYYGLYLAVALVFVTKLFDLYRLNWWPSSLGGAFWYTLFWSTSLCVGFLLHRFNLDGFGRDSRSRIPSPPMRGGRGDDDGGGGGSTDSWDWERKTTWVLLAFATMAMPALACFAKLRADRRNSWRRSLTPAQKTFLERQLTQRMPRSYRRFLWFLTAIALSLLTLLMGQGFATIYLSTLPHSNFEGLVYVWTLILSINLLNNVSNWILHRKVRSQALVFIFRLLYQLLYHVFYRNLFARLRSPDQAAYITLLSSSFVILWYPLSMSKTFHRVLQLTVGTPMDWAEYSHSVATKLTVFYLRNLSENVTMVAFLGWVTILHWGPNQLIYPFFSFADPSDPYTYRLTISASLVIWAAELLSSYLARVVCWIAYRIDVTNVGLDQFREHPELVAACIWTSTHVLMDILLFLVKLNFR